MQPPGRGLAGGKSAKDLRERTLELPLTSCVRLCPLVSAGPGIASQEMGRYSPTYVACTPTGGMRMIYITHVAAYFP